MMEGVQGEVFPLVVMKLWIREVLLLVKEGYFSSLNHKNLKIVPCVGCYFIYSSGHNLWGNVDVSYSKSYSKFELLSISISNVIKLHSTALHDTILIELLPTHKRILALFVTANINKLINTFQIKNLNKFMLQ